MLRSNSSVRKEETLDFLYQQVRDSGGQSSWDWVADRKFAFYLREADLSSLINMTLNSTDTLEKKLETWYRRWKQEITEKRLRYLRVLLNKKLLISYWLTVEDPDLLRQGVSRVRVYMIPHKPDREFIKISGKDLR